MGEAVNANPMSGIIFIFGSVISLVCFAGTPLRPASSASLQLDKALVEVNGGRRLVSVKEGLDIVRGDLLTIREIWLEDRGREVSVVELIGYAPKRKDLSNDVRGKVINTSTDLSSELSVNKQGVDYVLRASGSGLNFGEMQIHLIEPRLDGVELTINGTRKFLSNGDVLSLRTTDQISVGRIVTNVRGNENVRHEMGVIREKSGQEHRELRFVRGNYIFGRISLQWQE